MENGRRGCYFWAITDDDSVFRARNMGDGEEQHVVGGLLNRDEGTERRRGGRRIVYEVGQDTPVTFLVEIEDEAGRAAAITCRTQTHLMVNFYPRAQVVWSLLKADFGGGVEGWGGLQEFQPLGAFRRVVRGN